MSLLDRIAAARAEVQGQAPAQPAAPAAIRLIERIGFTSRAIPEGEIISQRSGLGKDPVAASRDLARVVELPRRALDIENGAAAQKWTTLLRADETRCDCVARWGYCIKSLWPIQGHALEEASKVSGLLGLLGVGWGKTALDILLPMVVPGTKTALLLIPPDLRAQFFNRDYPQWSRHFKVPNLAGGTVLVAGRPALHVVAYSELSSAAATDLLKRIQPDLVIADEGSNLRRRTSARTKRFLRYFTEHNETNLCVLSGTLTSRSLKDYGHLSALALGEGSPLPLHYPALEEWAGAIDPPSAGSLPTPIGALRRLCAVGEDVRSGFRRRLVETSGVVATEAGSLGTSLVLRARMVEVPAQVTKVLADVRATWQRPDGEELVDAITKSAVCRQLAAGVYLRWMWPRGETKEQIEAWLTARKAWHKEVRERLKIAREHMDSPLLLARAAQRWHDGFVHIEEDGTRREYPPKTRHALSWESNSWLSWLAVRDTCEPETEAVWVSDYLVRDAVKCGGEGPTIIWYENDAVGRAIAELGGFPFYGPGPEASAGILNETGTRSIVASIRGHSLGKNLQRFSRNLVVQSMSDGGAWEQLLGRTHRSGQEADVVTCDVYRHTPEMAEALDQATERARYIQETTGARMRLLFASRTF